MSSEWVEDYTAVRGSPEYNRSVWASKEQQNRQLVIDARDDLKNQKKIIKSLKLSLGDAIPEKCWWAVDLIVGFCVKASISDELCGRVKKIQKNTMEPSTVSQIFQLWEINNISSLSVSSEENKQIILLSARLTRHVEQELAHLSSPERYMTPLGSGTLAPKSYSQMRYNKLNAMNISKLKELCRVRYLKVSGKKSEIVNRLHTEKWY
jgi:hypothetical protein